MRYVAGIFVGLMILITAVALAQSTQQISPNSNYTITSYPLYGAVVTPSDTVALTVPGQVRADSAGAIAAVCVGNDTGAPTSDDIVLTLVAGEFFPCVVKYVLSTGTTAATIHVFY